VTEKNRLFWSALATGQFLELKLSEQERINDCVDIVCQFPMVGVRMIVAKGLEHRRRFICGGFRIVYCIDKPKKSDTPGGEIIEHEVITIKRFKRA
jgi:mRNA-degrading endonuclease RelE of RelBE toxin-antitoxin system